jgi:hypothetical protein
LHEISNHIGVRVANVAKFKNITYKELQWLQDLSKINGDNVNNVKYKDRKHIRNKKREYLKDKINGLATNIKNKNIRDLYRGINEFKKGYQLRRFQDNILNISKFYFSQLMNVHSSDVRQIAMLKAELFLPDPIPRQHF